MGFGVLANLHKNISQIDKIKKDASAYERPRRTVKEMIEIVFGENPSIVSMLLPTSNK